MEKYRQKKVEVLHCGRTISWSSPRATLGRTVKYKKPMTPEINEQKKKIFLGKKYLIIGIVAVVLVGASVGGYFTFKKAKSNNSQPPEKWEEYQNADLKIKLSYPASLSQISLSEEDKTSKVLLRLERKEPQALITFRYEEGLGMLKAAGGSILDKLVESINRQYPTRYPDYNKEKYEELIIGNEKAARFYFTYTGNDQQTKIKQQFTVVVKDTTGYYLAAQAPEAVFDQSASDFEKIAESFKFEQ